MTHPYREELAGRVEKIAGLGYQKWEQDTLRQAAAALRQSPSVEEVHDAILTSLYGPCDQISDAQDAALYEAAQAIAALYGRGG